MFCLNGLKQFIKCDGLYRTVLRRFNGFDRGITEYEVDYFDTSHKQRYNIWLGTRNIKSIQFNERVTDIPRLNSWFLSGTYNKYDRCIAKLGDCNIPNILDNIINSIGENEISVDTTFSRWKDLTLLTGNAKGYKWSSSNYIKIFKHAYNLKQFEEMLQFIKSSEIFQPIWEKNVDFVQWNLDESILLLESFGNTIQYDIRRSIHVNVGDITTDEEVNELIQKLESCLYKLKVLYSCGASDRMYLMTRYTWYLTVGSISDENFQKLTSHIFRSDYRHVFFVFKR